MASTPYPADPRIDAALPSEAQEAAPSESRVISPETYEPTDEERQKAALVENAAVEGRTIRRPHEQQWFVNKAMDRGNQYVVSIDGRAGLSTPPAPSYRVRLTINKIQPTLRSRASKFLRGRPVAQVIPATGDATDRQNARFTGRALDYQTRRLRIEAKYGDAVRTAQLFGHGYWWLSWDPSVSARVRVKDPLTGQYSLEVLPNAGDLSLEVDSTWSLVVADATLPYIGDQPWIVRQKVRSLSYIRARFQGRGAYVAGEISKDDALRYETLIGALNPQGIGGAGLPEGREASLGARADTEGASQPSKSFAVVKEYFEKPCPDYPQGRYFVVANGVLLKEQDFLPYEFHDLPNPYPVVDFPDIPQVGQYWGTTICEQLIPMQREYNLLRSKLAEHLRLLVHPKILVAKQHQLQPGSWTSQAGEIIEYFAIPHLPEPKPWVPPNIAADTWRSFELLNREMADVAHIYPESEGQTGSATSGFQTNLLQEATDAIHQPDVEAHQRILEEAYYKIRRLMKQGYTLERLLTVSGHDMEPEAFEFSGEQIDDYADIVMVATSALPKLPSARAQQILEYWKAGVYGPAEDPEARRRVIAQLEMGTVEDLYTDARKDEQQAAVENDAFLDGAPLPPPQFYENHDLHYKVHTDLLKSPRQWQPGQREALVAHVILHVKFQNPQSAIQLALQVGMPQLVQDILPPPQDPGAPPPDGMPPQNAPPAQAGPAGPPNSMGPASPGPQAPQGGPPPPGPAPGPFV